LLLRGIGSGKALVILLRHLRDGGIAGSVQVHCLPEPLLLRGGLCLLLGERTLICLCLRLVKQFGLPHRLPITLLLAGEVEFLRGLLLCKVLCSGSVCHLLCLLTHPKLLQQGFAVKLLPSHCLLVGLLLRLVKCLTRGQRLLEVLRPSGVDDLLQLRLLTELLTAELCGQFCRALCLTKALCLCGTLGFLGGKTHLQVLLDGLVFHLLCGLALSKVLRDGAINRLLRLLSSLERC